MSDLVVGDFVRIENSHPDGRLVGIVTGIEGDVFVVSYAGYHWEHTRDSLEKVSA